MADLENTRKSSKASNSPAWKNFTGEMYKKTVLHRLCKHIELDFENPTQKNAFNAGVEIETDPEKAVQNEIDECANSEEFVVESDGYSEEPVPAAEPVETEIPSLKAFDLKLNVCSPFSIDSSKSSPSRTSFA